MDDNQVSVSSLYLHTQLCVCKKTNCKNLKKITPHPCILWQGENNGYNFFGLKELHAWVFELCQWFNRSSVDHLCTQWHCDKEW